MKSRPPKIILYIIAICLSAFLIVQACLHFRGGFFMLGVGKSGIPFLSDNFSHDSSAWNPCLGAWVREEGEYRHKEVGMAYGIQSSTAAGLNSFLPVVTVKVRPSHIYPDSKTTLTISSTSKLDKLKLTVINPKGTTWHIANLKECVGKKSINIVFPDDFADANLDEYGTYKVVATLGKSSSYVLLGIREKPLVTFIHITDVHALESGNNLEELKSFVNDVNSRKDFPQPDFVVITGDITEHGTLAELTAVKDALDKLKVPYYPTNGGHDIISERDAECGKNWSIVFGKDKFSYSWAIGKFLFIAIDVQAPYGGFGGTVSSSEHLAWLKNLLAANSDKYAFLFSHHTFEPVRDAGKGMAYWNGGFVIFFPDPNSAEVRNILESDKNFIAQYGGHSHLNGMVAKNGVHYIQTTGFVTMDEYRYVELYSDRLESHIFKKSIYNYDWRRSYWVGSTDSSHNASLYGYGLPRERHFKIFFANKKEVILDSISVAGLSSWKDYTYQTDIMLEKESGVGENIAGIVFRYVDGGNYYSVILDSPADVIKLMKKQGGVATDLVVQPEAIDQNIWYHLKVVAQGESIKVYLNDNLKIDAIDATFAAGKIGFKSYRADTSYDNVLVTANDLSSR